MAELTKNAALQARATTAWHVMRKNGALMPELPDRKTCGMCEQDDGGCSKHSTRTLQAGPTLT